jgi:hypothetical protein
VGFPPILEGQSKAYTALRRALIANPTADDREDSPELPGDTHSTDEPPPTLDAFALTSSPLPSVTPPCPPCLRGEPPLSASNLTRCEVENEGTGQSATSSQPARW